MCFAVSASVWATHVGDVAVRNVTGETVRPLQSEAGSGTAKKAWKSVKAVFGSEKIKSYRENLESAKATLLLAQIQLHQ